MDASSDFEEERMREELAAPLAELPSFEFAFAYGSRVFRQQNASSEDSMVDYIIGVSSPASWHSENIEKNPDHYTSWLACFGGKVISDVANIAGVGVHFNPFVRWRDKTIKYGVIGLPELLDDVRTWNRLYISGRLQKPVRVLADEAGVLKENGRNLRAALSAAVLMLPREFSEEQLYETVCGLSYTGDIRLLFAEDQNKVSNIVQGNFLKFRELYKGPIRQAVDNGVLQVENGQSPHFLHVPGRHSVQALVENLPSTVIQRLAAKTGVKLQGVSVTDALLRHGNGSGKLVKQAVASIVRSSSMKQALSGALAVGGVNAFRYTANKIRKAWNSTR